MLTYLIIAITCLVSIPAFSQLRSTISPWGRDRNPQRELFSKLLFNPKIIHTNKEWYRFITHAFLHADWIHLIMNMYVLYIFGSLTEKIFIFYLGTIRGEISFFLLYFISIIASVIPSYKKHIDNMYYNAVGASGAVSAVVFSAIILNPQMNLALMFLPIPVPAPVFGLLYLGYCWYAAKHSHDNVAHDVHYWGSLFGVLFTLVVLPESFFAFIEAIRNLFNM